MSSTNQPTNENVAEIVAQPCCAHPGCDKPVAMEDIVFTLTHKKTRIVNVFTEITFTEEQFIDEMDEDNQEKWRALPHDKRVEVWKKFQEDFPFRLGGANECDEGENAVDDWDEEEEEREDEDAAYGHFRCVDEDIDSAIRDIETHLVEEVFPTPEEKKENHILDLKKRITELDDSLFRQAEAFKAEFMKKVAAAREATEKQVASLRQELTDLTLATV